MFNIKGKDASILRGEKDGNYRSAFGLSQSAFSKFFVSPKHYIHSTENPIKPTPDMIFGTCFHSLMLDEKPCYVVGPKFDLRKTADKEAKAKFEAENAGKELITEEDELALRGMREAVLTNGGLATELYKKSKEKELCLFATAMTDEGEVRLKGMLDGYDEATGTIWDFKKCRDASGTAFTRMVRERMYWVQAVHYTWLAIQNGLTVNRFVYIPVEDKAPHGLACYTFDITKKMKYHPMSPVAMWEQGLNDFLLCQKDGDWVGYPSHLQEIEI